MTTAPVSAGRISTDNGRLLRLALRVDAVASGALGVLGLAGAPLLTDVLGAQSVIFRATGAFLVGYAAALVVIAARPRIPRPAAWTVVIGNTAWVLGSVLAVVAGRASLTALGVAFVLAQAVAVAVFADLQWMGLRRMGAGGQRSESL
jgi:biotin transporter BioY